MNDHNISQPFTQRGDQLTPVRADDPINHPSHYQVGGIESITVIEAWGLGFCLGNVIKYISRAGRKNRTTLVEDLKKARWYLDREIARLEML